MRTTLETLTPFDLDDVTDGDLISYFRARDILEDPHLTVGRKRALLAYWASDIHAVAGAPALRAYAGGVSVTIDELLDALKALDTQVDAAALAQGGFATGATQ